MQAVHEDEGAHREQLQRSPWRLWVQAQCSWAEGDAGGALKQQLEALQAALEQRQKQAASGGASSKAAGAEAPAGAAAAAGACFPATSPASAEARREAQRAEQLALVVGLPSLTDVAGLLQGLAAADRLRLEGNAAVKAGKAADAVAKYSEALAGAWGRRAGGQAVAAGWLWAVVELSAVALRVGCVLS